MTGADVYHWFIEGFGDFGSFRGTHYTVIDIGLMGTVIAFMVQMYFCYRIWTLTKNVWLCAVITVVCVPDLHRVCPALDIP